jgi:hypothetical protein
MDDSDIEGTAIRVAQNINGLDACEQYTILFEAMEAVINGETDKTMLALIANQLFELSEKALDKSGYEIQGTPPLPTIN